jgi:hypothetical protein
MVTIVVTVNRARVVWRNNSVGTATELRAGRSGDQTPVKNKIFCIRPDRSRNPHNLLHNEHRTIPGGKEVGAWS